MGEVGEISKARCIYISTVGGSGLHEVGKWRVSGGQERKQGRVRMNLTVERRAGGDDGEGIKVGSLTITVFSIFQCLGK